VHVISATWRQVEVDHMPISATSMPARRCRSRPGRGVRLESIGERAALPLRAVGVDHATLCRPRHDFATLSGDGLVRVKTSVRAVSSSSAREARSFLLADEKNLLLAALSGALRVTSTRTGSCRWRSAKLATSPAMVARRAASAARRTLARMRRAAA